MKEPRSGDFDPHAKERDLKSPLTAFPAIEQPTPLPPADGKQQPVPPVRPVRDVLPDAASQRKVMIRHPFDIYAVQLAEFKQLALDDRMRGGTGSMSAMVRQALDDYLAKVRG